MLNFLFITIAEAIGGISHKCASSLMGAQMSRVYVGD